MKENVRRGTPRRGIKKTNCGEERDVEEITLGVAERVF